MTSPSVIENQIAAMLSEISSTEPGVDLNKFRLRRDDRGRIVGDFFKCRLSSTFQQVVSSTDGRVIAHEARVRCDGWGEEAISPWGIFSMIAGDSALVQLDRLCRTLHILNYFHRAQPEYRLLLRVEPRLLTAVGSDHGRVFSRILAHLDLPTSRVIIELPVEAAADHELLSRATGNYRINGYGIALNLPGDNCAAFDDIKPDYLKVDIKRLNSKGSLQLITAHSARWNGQVIASKLETPEDIAIATDAHVPLLQGYGVSRPDFELSVPDGLSEVLNPAPVTTHVAKSGHTSKVRLQQY